MYQVYTEKEILAMATKDEQAKKLLAIVSLSKSKITKFKTLLKIAHLFIPTAGPVMISVEDDAEVGELFSELNESFGESPPCKDDAVLIGEDAVACHSVALLFMRNYFWDEFSKLVASCLKLVPEELHDRAKEEMQDSASVYGSRYDKYLKKLGIR